MIDPAEKFAADTVLETDICIVGAGAAGIAMALRLAGRGRKVLVLEAGSETETDADKEMLRGEIANPSLHSPLDQYRHRTLGGSSTTWGGRCIPFDPIDFEQRDWVPHSGWPISSEDLAPYYADALRVAEAGDDDFDARTAVPGGMRPMVEHLSLCNFALDGIERSSTPTNFGRRYRRILEELSDTTLLLGANVTELIVGDGAGQVTSLEVKTGSNKRLTVRAAQYVLASGGIEVARLLLASRRHNGVGIGNERDLVGRYYMCHIAGTTGQVTFSCPPDEIFHSYERTWDGVYVRRRIHLTGEAQRQHKLTNVIARLHHPRLPDPAHGRGILSMIYLARPFVSYEYAKRLHSDDPVTLWMYVRHILNVLREPIATAKFLANWAWTRTLAARKFPSLIVAPRNNRYTLDVHAEQVPNPESRVTLSVETDRFGMPRAKVDWRYLPQDIESVSSAMRLLAVDLERSGKAQLDFDPAGIKHDMLRDGAYGGHHIGTARMGKTPETGVVDSECRVFGIANLSIASSAVFPTSSQANPTLTILAIALRLADRLAPPIQAAVTS